jgi:hypothetical protein
MAKATGSFDVKMTAEPPYSELDGVVLARARFDKRFAGPLEATSEVQMLAVTTPDPASRAYVALERISGTLDGKKGTFVVVHQAVAQASGPVLSIVVVPGTGTGELRGLSGRMNVRIEPGGAHFYDLDYELGSAFT